MWVKISGHVEDPNTLPRVMAVGGPCSVEGCLGRHMYNSSVCYKHKGHKHEVERAPPPVPLKRSSAPWLVGLLFPDVIYVLILTLVMAIKWVPWLFLAALAILVMVRRMAPDPSEDDEEEIGRKEIFDYFILPWIGLAVLAIVWFLVPPGD